MKEWWIEQEYNENTKKNEQKNEELNFIYKINRRREDLPQGPHNRQFSRPVRKTFSTSFYDQFCSIVYYYFIDFMKKKKNWFNHPKRLAK